MAKHAAPGPVEVRSSSYPIFVDQPLCWYMSDNSDKKEWARNACTTLDRMVRDHLGLSTSSRIIKLTPGTEVDPSTNEVETYDFVRIAVFFSNVARDELDHYSEVLTGLVSEGTHAVFAHPEQVLPQPSISVPSSDELRSERQAAVEQAAKSTSVLNGQGEMDPSKIEPAVSALREEQERDTTTSLSSSPSSGGSDRGKSSAVQDQVEEMKRQGRPLHEMF